MLGLLFRISIWAFIFAGLLLIGQGLLNEHRGVGPSTGEIVAMLANRIGVPTRSTSSPGGAYPRRSQSTSKPIPLNKFTTTADQLKTAIGCFSPPATENDPGNSTVSYQWRDAEGVAHFSDSPPTNGEATEKALRTGSGDFFVTVEADDAVLPAHLEGYINAGASRAYDIWRDWIGADALVRSHINLRFIGDQEQFNKIYGSSGANGWMPTGFYRIRTNEAFVLYTQRQVPTVVGTAFHEMSHLITAWHLGPTPPWLNEGIAEYFETMEVSWQSARFNHNRNHLYRLHRDGLPSLDELTSIRGRDWMNGDAELRYAAAWSLIAFLLDSDAGDKTLKTVLQSAQAQRCGSGADYQRSLSSYPGGLVELENDWRNWVSTHSG